MRLPLCGAAKIICEVKTLDSLGSGEAADGLEFIQVRDRDQHRWYVAGIHVSVAVVPNTVPAMLVALNCEEPALMFPEQVTPP